MIFFCVKIIDFHNDSIPVDLSFNKDLYNRVRHRYDFEIRFGIEDLKSWLLPKNFLKRPFCKILFCMCFSWPSN